MWSRILLAVPGSRLVLKNKPFACEARKAVHSFCFCCIVQSGSPLVLKNKPFACEASSGGFDWQPARLGACHAMLCYPMPCSTAPALQAAPLILCCNPISYASTPPTGGAQPVLAGV